MYGIIAGTICANLVASFWVLKDTNLTRTVFQVIPRVTGRGVGHAGGQDRRGDGQYGVKPEV